VEKRRPLADSQPELTAIRGQKKSAKENFGNGQFTKRRLDSGGERKSILILGARKTLEGEETPEVLTLG